MFIASPLVYCMGSFERTLALTTLNLGGSPGLVVMGGDSYSKSREFESRHHILDGHFSHVFVVKIVMCV